MRCIGTCLCGWDEPYRSPQWHRARHAEWAGGIRMPGGIAAGDGGILRVPAGKPSKLRAVAYRMARLFQREGGYDFASFDYPAVHPWRSHDWRTYRTTAYLYVADGRAIGYCVVRMRSWSWPYDLCDRRLPQMSTRREGLWPSVDVAFVCRDYRRQGIARRLIEAVASDHGTEPGGLAYGFPFTDAGAAAVLSVCGRVVNATR